MAELRNVDLNLLILFQHLLEDRNLSAVARRMDLTQPAVSNALRRLREAFGDELFVRTAQGMLPTPRAQRLAGPVSEALTMLTQALQDQDVFDAATSNRRFRVAMTDVGEIHFMPRLMEVCVQVAPQVRIDSVRVQGPDRRVKWNRAGWTWPSARSMKWGRARCSACCSGRATRPCSARRIRRRTRAWASRRFAPSGI